MHRRVAVHFWLSADGEVAFVNDEVIEGGKVCGQGVVVGLALLEFELCHYSGKVCQVQVVQPVVLPQSSP